MRGFWRFLLDIVEHKLGRAICIIVGAGMILAAFFEAAPRNPFAITAILCGTVLIAVGSLVDRISELAVNLSGLKIKTHPPATTTEETAATARSVEEDPNLSRGVHVDPGDVDNLARYQVADAAIKRVLIADDTSVLFGSEMHLYLFDSERDCLLPVFEPDDSPSEGWPSGKGAVGFAWQEAQLISATAPETHDSTFHLTPEQQQRYDDLTAVAAIPVFNSGGDIIAVLAASTTDAHEKLTSEAGLADLEARAAGVARVLIDVLQWFSDD